MKIKVTSPQSCPLGRTDGQLSLPLQQGYQQGASASSLLGHCLLGLCSKHQKAPVGTRQMTLNHRIICCQLSPLTPRMCARIEPG